MDIEDALAALTRRQLVAKDSLELIETEDEDTRPDSDEAEVSNAPIQINEVSSSGMFALEPPNVAEEEKLRFAVEAVGNHTAQKGISSSCLKGSTELGRTELQEPYIHVSRGDEFADSFDVWFFAKTFPTLMPFGVGGPRMLEETVLQKEGQDLDVADGVVGRQQRQVLYHLET